MCQNNNYYLESDAVRTKAYKVVKKWGNRYWTMHQAMNIQIGEVYEAKRTTSDELFVKGNIITGGAFHVYKTKKAAKSECWFAPQCYKLMEVEVEGYIASGYNDNHIPTACYERIRYVKEIPW